MNSALRSIVGPACVAAALLLVGTSANALWPTTTTPFLVGNTPGDNGIPQVAALADGGCYILWRSWDIPAGYSTRLQRLDAAGNEMWAHNGVVVAQGDSTFTIVGGADLAVASDGTSALVSVDTASDPANPGVRQCNIQKISNAGAKLWGTGGGNVAVSTGSGWGVPAHVCNMPDGGCVVAYTTDVPATTGHDYITMVRYTAAGERAWAADKYIFSATSDFVVCDIQPADSDNFIVSWLVPATQAALQTQKFNGLGNAATGWTTPKVLDASGLTSHDFPTFTSDGGGGAIYAWRSYANSGSAAPSEAKLQHILSDGTMKFGTTALNCFLAAATPGQGRQTASLDFTRDSGTGEYTYFVACTQGPISNGTARSSVVQKIDNSGNLLWTGAGFTAMPESSNQQVGPGNTTCVANGDGGCTVMGTVVRGFSTTNRIVYAVRVFQTGAFADAVWNVLLDPDVSTDKGRMSAVRQATSNDALLAFTRGGGLGGTIAAVRVANLDGAPGMPESSLMKPVVTVDVPATISACRGDTVQIAIQVTGTAPISFNWQRHYGSAISAPDAFWGLSDGNSAFGCVIANDGTTYAGAHTATLTINNIQPMPVIISNPNTVPPCSVTTSPSNNLYRCLLFNSYDEIVYTSVVYVDVTDCSPACPGNHNGDGQVDPDDLFAFLDDWFAQNGVCSGGGCTADYVAPDQVDPDDLFAFLDLWFANNGNTCP
jgi:hypothetical protein